SMLRMGVQKGKISEEIARAAMGRMQTAGDLEPAVRTADLIIEAVPEELELKKDLFSQADLFCSEESILATNTSSISITALAAADIDRAMELGYNHPMGPLRLTDLVGLDVRLKIAEYLAQTLGPRFEPPELLRRMVREGKLGKKTGRGFYEWNDER